MIGGRREYETLAALIIASNQAKWEQVNSQNLEWFIGRAMKISQGTANPATFREIFNEKLLKKKAND